ncbi:MAG: hypothetical protein WA152_00920 [Microgenomates group bacterium]
MFKIKQLPKSIADAINKSPMIIGIAPSAWPRAISGYYFPKFKMLCSNDCQDNELIRLAGIPVYSQKQVDKNVEISPITPGNIISTDIAKKFLKGLNEPFKFLIYKSMGRFEKVCDENGWSFLGNKMEVRDQFENKKIFKEIIRELGIDAIPGDNLPIPDVTIDTIKKYQEKFNVKKVVLQLAEATWGGGSGTFFIETEEDFNKYNARVSELYSKLKDTKKRIDTVNIAPFIEGVSSSIPCCATRFGTLTGSIQTQLVDVPEVGAKLPTRSGVFAGHDWSFKKFSDKSQMEATEIGQKFGDYIYKKGYRGIFGLDLIVDDNGKVWPVECNPRETDAFPLITMLQMEAGAIPMQVFHNLEHLNSDYEIDFKEIDETYKVNYKASQILIYNRSTEFMVDRYVIRAGVYRMDGDTLEFVRPGFATWDIQNDDEFLLTEDIAKTVGNIYDPHERMLRLIRKGPMLNPDGSFRRDATLIIERIYNSLGLVDAELGFVEENGVSILTEKRIKNVKKDVNYKKADIVNTVKDQGKGIRRPRNIAWRMNIDNRPIMDQIRANRTRKQITSDLNKIKDLGIEIEVVKEINQKQFGEWFVLYKKLIERIPGGHLALNEKWFEKKKIDGKVVGGIFATQNNKLVGGELFLEKNKILGIGYGVSERFNELNGGLTLLMDYKFLEYAQGLGYGEASFGQDGNLYGYDLNPGLIQYKTKIGFSPVPSKKSIWVNTFMTKLKKIKGDVMFFSGDETKIDTLVVLTRNSKDTDYSAYLPKEVKNIKILDLKETVIEHKKIFNKNG